MKKALVLAAGLGTRLRPLTETMPKSMVPVVGHPIIAYVLEACYLHGIESVIMNLHYFPDLIKDYFGHTYKGMRLEYIYEPQLLENAGALDNVRDFFDGEDEILVVASDNIADFDFQAMAALHRKKGGLATIATTPTTDPSKYGIVDCTTDGRIKQFQEKPSPAEACSDLAATCCYLFSPQIFDYLPRGKASHFGKEIFPRLLELGEALYTFQHNGYWNDVGNPYNYRESNWDVLAGKLKLPNLAPTTPQQHHIDNNTTINDSNLNNHLVIGEKTTITDSTLQETLCYPQNTITASTLTNCIIGNECTLTNCTLTNVVLGEGVTLEGITLSDTAIWPHGTVKQL